MGNYPDAGQLVLVAELPAIDHDIRPLGPYSILLLF
jgi:hypothetical protein